MDSGKLVLTNGTETIHLSRDMIGGYSVNSEGNYSSVFFKGGMSWPIDNSEDNAKQLRTLKL